MVSTQRFRIRQHVLSRVRRTKYRFRVYCDFCWCNLPSKLHDNSTSFKQSEGSPTNFNSWLLWVWMATMYKGWLSSQPLVGCHTNSLVYACRPALGNNPHWWISESDCSIGSKPQPQLCQSLCSKTCCGFHLIPAWYRVPCLFMSK